VLHAFRVQDTGDASEKGEELWGYIPGIVLDKIHRQYPYSHDWNVDSTPIVRDIRVKKNLSTTPEDEEWMAILVGGLRQGGRGYYALDVTDPTEFQGNNTTSVAGGGTVDNTDLLWEIDHRTPGFSGMQLTYATPFVGTVFVPDPDESGNPLSEIAAVVFPGGLDPVDRNHSTGLYVVSATNGTLIKKLEPEFPTELGCGPSVDCGLRPECCAQLISNPVGYGSIPGLVTTRVFVGDDRGRLWRADLASADPDDWHLTLFYPDPDPFADDPTMPYLTAEPVENPIGLAVDEEGKLVLLFGTGNVDDLPGMGQNYLFSLTEEYVWDSTNGIYNGKARFNWRIAFEQGEKLLGQPIVFDEVAYFSTFIPYTDEDDYCVIGEGRIWGVHYNSVDPNLDEVALSGWSVDTEPTASEDFAQLDQDGLEGGDKDVYVSYDNTLISGLTIIQRPSCLEIDMSSGVDFGSGQQEVYELVAQVSGPGGTRKGNQQTPTITMKIPAPKLRSTADSWGSVIE
jgi:type IV pilus assembly protein PilY1